MHPAVEAGLEYWRAIESNPNKWARISIDQSRDEVQVTVGYYNYRGEKQREIVSYKFYVDDEGIVHTVTYPHS